MLAGSQVVGRRAGMRADGRRRAGGGVRVVGGVRRVLALLWL